MSFWFSHGYSKLKDWNQYLSPTLRSPEGDLIFIMASVQSDTSHMHL